MEVVHLRREEQAPDAREDGVADVLVQERHRARVNATRESVAHHEVVPFAQALQERIDARKVVAVVGIAHDDELALRRLDPALKSSAVPLALHRHDPGAGARGELSRPVGAPVVGDDHFTDDAEPVEALQRVAHARLDGLRLVKARHHDRQLDRIRDHLSQRSDVYHLPRMGYLGLLPIHSNHHNTVHPGFTEPKSCACMIDSACPH